LIFSERELFLYVILSEQFYVYLQYYLNCEQCIKYEAFNKGDMTGEQNIVLVYALDGENGSY